LPFLALMKFNSLCSLFLNYSSSSLREQLLVDATWSKLTGLVTNVEQYFKSGNEQLLMNKRGEQDNYSQSASTNSIPEVANIRNRFASRGDFFPQQGQSDLDFDPTSIDPLEIKVASNLAERERINEMLNQTNNLLIDGFVASSNISSRFAGMKEMANSGSSQVSKFKAPEVAVANIAEPAETYEQDKVQESRILNGMKGLTGMLPSKDIELFKGILTDSFFQEKLKQSRLQQIFGILLEQVDKPETSTLKPIEEVIHIPLQQEKDLNIPNIQKNLQKIDLSLDTFQKFTDDLGQYLKDREKNLMEMKKIFEEKEREERETKELALHELEKRRGGWRANRQRAQNQQQLLEAARVPDAFAISKRIDLKNVTNYDPRMFVYFDKDKVVPTIENPEVEEKYENCIPEEELYGTLASPRPCRQLPLPQLALEVLLEHFLREPAPTAHLGEERLPQQLPLPTQRVRQLQREHRQLPHRQHPLAGRRLEEGPRRDGKEERQGRSPQAVQHDLGHQVPQRLHQVPEDEEVRRAAELDRQLRRARPLLDQQESPDDPREGPERPQPSRHHLLAPLARLCQSLRAIINNSDGLRGVDLSRFLERRLPGHG